jgi:TP901 family phage tail tape measure protein
MIIGRFQTLLTLTSTQFETAIKSASNAAGQFGKKVETVGETIAKFKADFNMSNIFKSAVGLSTGINAINKAFSLFWGTIRKGIDLNIEFEKSMSVLGSVLGKTRDQMASLEAQARLLGATTPATASEVVELQTELAKLGFVEREIRNSTEAVLNFSLATGSTLPDAAKLAGAVLRSFGDDARNMDRYVSAMSVATTKSALTFGDLQVQIPIVSSVAKTFGFEIEDILALLGKLADAGFDASMAATATRNILLNLADTNQKLGKALGKPVKSLRDLVEGLVTLNNKGIDLATTLELTDKRSVAAFNTFLRMGDSLLSLRGAITDVNEEFKKMVATRTDNVAGSLKQLESAWEEYVLGLQSSMGPLKALVDLLTDLVRLLPGGKTIEIDIINAEQEGLKKAEEYVKKGRPDATTALNEWGLLGSLNGVPKAAGVTPKRNILYDNIQDVANAVPENDITKKIQTLQEDNIKFRKTIDSAKEELRKLDEEERTREKTLIEAFLPKQVHPLTKKYTEILTNATAELDYNEQLINELNTRDEKIKTAKKPLTDDEIKAKIEEMQKYLYNHPNLAPEVKVKYLNDIASLEASLEETKKKLAKENYENLKLVHASGVLPLEPLPPFTKGIKETGGIPILKRNTEEMSPKEKKINLDVQKQQSQEMAAFAKKAQADNVDNIVNKQAAIEKKRSELMLTGSAERREILKAEIAGMEKELEAMTANPISVNEMFSGVSGVLSGIDSMVSGFERLGKVLEEDASAWDVFMGIVGAIQGVLGGIQSFIKLTELLEIATAAATTAKIAEGVTDTAVTSTEIANDVAGAASTVGAETTEMIVKKASSLANYNNAVTGAASAVANIPVVGPGLAAAAVTEMIALLTPFVATFAQGGVAGIVGGSSFSGDKIPIRVNSGEMILNKGQQAALYKAMHPYAGGGITGWQQKQLFGEIKGLPRFATGGIAGKGFNIPSIYMPKGVEDVGKDTARQVQPMEVKVNVGGRLTADGDKIVAVISEVQKRKIGGFRK